MDQNPLDLIKNELKSVINWHRPLIGIRLSLSDSNQTDLVIQNWNPNVNQKSKFDLEALIA